MSPLVPEEFMGEKWLQFDGWTSAQARQRGIAQCHLLWRRTLWAERASVGPFAGKWCPARPVASVIGSKTAPLVSK